MANISTSGLDEIIGNMEEIAQIPDSVLLDMLTAEAEIVAAEQKAQADAMLSGEYSKGITGEGIDFDKKLKETSDGKAIYVYPKGTRTDGNRRRKAEVAFINEYGKKGQPARPFIRTANEKAADAAANAALQVYDKFLQSKNL